MSQSQQPLVVIAPRSFGQTSRKDNWWIVPLLVFLGLGAFVVYSTWAAFQGAHYRYIGGGANYISPFYSPELFGCPHSLVRPKTDLDPRLASWSPGLS